MLLDKPEDRLYHAADQTWWKWEGGRLVAADGPVPAQPQPPAVDVAGWLRFGVGDATDLNLRLRLADAWTRAHPAPVAETEGPNREALMALWKALRCMQHWALTGETRAALARCEAESRGKEADRG